MTSNIAVFGLGSMGFGVAASLIRAGHKIWGFDLSQDAVQRLCDAGGHHASFGDIAAELDAVIIVVLNAKQARGLLTSEPAIASHLRPETVVINCTTIAPEEAKEMAMICAQAQIAYLDAPISGGAAKAMSGQLSIMASGDDSAFARAEACLSAMAEKIFTIGDEVGLGSAMKAVNQMLAGVHIAATAEAMTFALSQGIAAQQCLEVISESAGASWMFENRAPHIVEADYTPKSAVNIWPKDLGIVMDIASQHKCTTPLTEAALSQFNEAVMHGYGTEDDAAVAKIYAAKNKVTLPA